MEPQKFLAEQLGQLLFHVTSAKSIASQVLASTPDPSHWRDSFQRGTDTLNYFKHVLSSLHSSGFNYPVYMQDFFSYYTPTGSISQGPVPKRRKTSGEGVPTLTPTPTTAAEDVPEAQPAVDPPESQTADLYRPSHGPIQQSLYAYDCYNVNIQDPKYNIFTKVPQCCLIRGATVGLSLIVKKNCLLMSALCTWIKCINVQIVAHSAETTGQPGSTLGHNICTFTPIIALLAPANLVKTTNHMAMMINVWCGCIWKKKTQINISFRVP